MMVPWVAVNACRVDEPLSKRLVRVANPPVKFPIVPRFVLKLVVEARPET